ncbi:MAG: RNA 3'-terminal phosphate cyclase [Candidatus Thorarchaeota archaeon]
MIEIDGSYGEGGGQILRTAVSLSALTLQPIRITKIRAGRPKPGLKRQHIAGIELTGRLVNAEIKGLEIGSETIEFKPGERGAGIFDYDIGTAGSVSLVLQAVLPPAILSDEPVGFRLRGGTDVSWSPPVDYLREVFVPILARMGPRLAIIQERRGHYPKGGGKVSVDTTPCEKISPASFVDFGNLKTVSGISHCVKLPPHVAERQAESAEDILSERGLSFQSIVRESYQRHNDPHLGPGSGIVLWAESDTGNRLGADVLGSKGKRAELVGSEAARRLVQDLSTTKAIDSHLCDMLIPYMALAKGESLMGVTEVTSHLTTNIWVAHHILGAEIDIQGQVGSPGLVRIRGVGLSLAQ